MSRSMIGFEQHVFLPLSKSKGVIPVICRLVPIPNISKSFGQHLLNLLFI